MGQLWFLYSTLPTRTSADARSQIELRWDVVRLKREMNSTSSQDEFAKWAKLRRQHDKVMADYEQKSTWFSDVSTTFVSDQHNLCDANPDDNYSTIPPILQDLLRQRHHSLTVGRNERDSSHPTILVFENTAFLVTERLGPELCGVDTVLS